jgi:hypothetical protein
VAVGRQVEFHVLPDDLMMLLEFANKRNEVVVTARSSDTPDVLPVADPRDQTEAMTLWNRSILSDLKRELIVRPGHNYYRINESLPTLEIVPSIKCIWNGKPGLLKGRIYGLFDNPAKDYVAWFASLSRWIRTHFVKNPVEMFGGYVGPSAMDWFHKGGVLLPMLVPPVTEQWVTFIDSQHPSSIGDKSGTAESRDKSA